MGNIEENKKVFLTVFTPTYNRETTLHLNYEALKRQSDKDFTWMIVDDGSTDGTEKLVESWIKAGVISINYYKQKNSGKPAATNFSIENSNSVLWICVDSDDFLSEDAVAQIRKLYAKARLNKCCAGIVGIKCDVSKKERHQNDKKRRNIRKKKCPDFVHLWEITAKYKIEGERVLVFELSKLKTYRYPIIEGEKFIGESYLYEQIGSDYDFYLTDDNLYYYHYQEDGLTANYLNLHIKNPIGNKCLKELEIKTPKPLSKRFKCAVMYVAACLLCGDRNIVKNSPRKILTFFAYPLGIVAYKKKYYPLIKD